MSRTLRSQGGYSLAEMLVVVAIIGMLALVMVPNFITFYQSNKMKSSMRNFTTDVRAVRQLAISQGRQTMLTYQAAAGSRTYDWWMGDKPFASTTWTKQTGTAARPSKRLDDIAYFPAGNTLQTFTDFMNCTTNCVGDISAPQNDGRIDVMFFPDGHVQLPTGLPAGTITIKTDLNKLPKPQYTITISPSGRVLAQ